MNGWTFAGLVFSQMAVGCFLMGMHRSDWYRFVNRTGLPLSLSQQRTDGRFVDWTVPSGGALKMWPKPNGEATIEVEADADAAASGGDREKGGGE